MTWVMDRLPGEIWRITLIQTASVGYNTMALDFATEAWWVNADSFWVIDFVETAWPVV